MDIIGDVRRGWAALGDDVRRRIWVVMIISFVTQVAMLFYPADRIAYSFSSEEAYVASLDYLNGVVLPLLAFLIVAGIVLTAVQIFQLVKAYSSIKRAYLERAFPGVAVPDRVQWPLIPAIGLFIALFKLAGFLPGILALAVDAAQADVSGIASNVFSLVLAVVLAPWMFRRFVLAAGGSAPR